MIHILWHTLHIDSCCLWNAIVSYLLFMFCMLLKCTNTISICINKVNHDIVINIANGGKWQFKVYYQKNSKLGLDLHCFVVESKVQNVSGKC